MRTDDDIIKKTVWALDRNPSEVSEIYDRFIDWIVNDIRAGKPVHIDGVGTLKLENQRISFTPDNDHNNRSD
jgi:nucleoid DNA-binding protein